MTFPRQWQELVLSGLRICINYNVVNLYCALALSLEPSFP